MKLCYMHTNCSLTILRKTVIFAVTIDNTTVYHGKATTIRPISQTSVTATPFCVHALYYGADYLQYVCNDDSSEILE